MSLRQFLTHYNACPWVLRCRRVTTYELMGKLAYQRAETVSTVEGNRRVVEFVADATSKCFVEEAEAGCDVGRGKVGWIRNICREERKCMVGRCRSHVRGGNEFVRIGEGERGGPLCQSQGASGVT